MDDSQQRHTMKVDPLIDVSFQGAPQQAQGHPVSYESPEPPPGWPPRREGDEAGDTMPKFGGQMKWVEVWQGLAPNETSPPLCDRPTKKIVRTPQTQG